jgi:hypothetical protein
MTAPSDQYCPGEDGQGRYPELEALDRDLERLGELTRAHVTDEKEDLGVAAGRILDLDLRREAEELLSRLRDAIGATPEAPEPPETPEALAAPEAPEALSETLAEPDTGPYPVLIPAGLFRGRGAGNSKSLAARVSSKSASAGTRARTGTAALLMDARRVNR